MEDSVILERIEQKVERYLRRDPLAEAKRVIDGTVSAHNDGVHAANLAAETAGRELDQERARTEQTAAAIAHLDVTLEIRPPASAAADVFDAYNARVRERNALATKHRQDVDALNTRVRAFNTHQQTSLSESERRKRELDAAIRQYDDSRKECIDWANKDGRKRLWDELNEMFARVGARASGAETPELRKVRALRREIAEFAASAQEKSQTGWLSVEARLGTEPVWLDVDTGASIVAVSPEVVNALNWSGYIGEPIELQLAGGLRLTAPQLLVPDMLVHGLSADHVKGAVIKDPGFGRDGSLGLSFLTRFKYSIVGGETPPCLHLSRKSSTPVREYDVFICHKSSDEEQARILFDHLRAEGFRPFFSPVSLGAKSGFQQGIDRALEDAPHMVVVGSSKANMEAPWVLGEWERFIAMRNIGRKTGNLVVLLCGEMKPEYLPVGLVNSQAISVQSDKWRDSIRSYLSR